MGTGNGTGQTVGPRVLATAELSSAQRSAQMDGCIAQVQALTRQVNVLTQAVAELQAGRVTQAQLLASLKADYDGHVLAEPSSFRQRLAWLFGYTYGR